MKDLPAGARFYIYVVSGLGIAAALASAVALLSDTSIILSLILQTVVLAALIAILDLFPVSFRSQHADVVLSSAVRLAAVLILVPTPVVLLATFFGTFISEWRQKRVWFKLIFNVGLFTVTLTLVAAAYQLLHQPQFKTLESVQNIAAVLLIGITDVGVNTLLMSLVLALTGSVPVRYVWVETFRPVMWHDLTMVPIGVFVALLWQVTAWSVILAVPPLLLTRHAYKMVNDLEWQTREALQALARVLDQRDEQTSTHSEQVSEYAEMIARSMGLSAGEVDVISRAAWLHDIGKVGMRNDILFKPGLLTTEERELAKQHAVIGGDLLKKFPLFEKGADLVRHHHEWWNGKGYPDGLVGEAIPLGARILAVADAYQAMTDERPYRKSLGERVALEELHRGAGGQFDPKVVEAFFRARGINYPRLDAETEVVTTERLRVAA